MKSILISIKPRFVAKILNGEKTVEVRKSMPKCDLPIDVYIYCTKDKQGIWLSNGKYDLLNENKYVKSEKNGKVVAKFTLNSVIKCKLINDSKFNDLFYSDYQITRKELKDYVGENAYYEWHIDNLEIFDKPKELSEFYKVGKKQSYKDCQHLLSKNDEKYYKLTKTPQSWCYVEN